MRILGVLLVFCCLQLCASGQTISYDIPAGYEKETSAKDYKRVVDAAVLEIGKKYHVASVKAGVVILSPAQDMQSFNLHNLVIDCKSVIDTNQWAPLIQYHFKMIFASLDEQKRVRNLSYDSVKNYLVLRIYPKNRIDELGGKDNIVCRTDLEGTYTVLMINMAAKGDVRAVLTPLLKTVYDDARTDSAGAWGLAARNVAQKKIAQQKLRFSPDSTEEVELTLLGNEEYAAAYALALKANAPHLVGSLGSIVVMPNKSLVDILPLLRGHTKDHYAFIELTYPEVQNAYTTGPDSISPHYYWYYKGRFTNISVTPAKDNKLSIILPPALQKLMKKR